MRAPRHAAPAAALVSAVVVTGERAWAQGCAMCGTVIGKDDPRASGFLWSVIFLMATPYVVGGLVAGWLYLATRRARRARGGPVPRLGEPIEETLS